MPSYRASLGIVDALAGIAPERVLETAREAVAGLRHVEDAFVDVAPLTRGDGLPRIVVRFLEPATNDAAEDAGAWQVAESMADGVRQVAITAGLRLWRRSRGRWLPRQASDPPDW